MKKLGLFITSAFLLAACGAQQPAVVSSKESKPEETSQIAESSEQLESAIESSEEEVISSEEGISSEDEVISSDEIISSDEVISSEEAIISSDEKAEPMLPEEAINAIAYYWGGQAIEVEEGVFGAFGAFDVTQAPVESLKQYIENVFTPEEFVMIEDWAFKDNVWGCFYMNEVDTVLEYYVYEQTVYLDEQGMIHEENSDGFTSVDASFIEVYGYTYVEPEVEPLVINVNNLLGYVDTNIPYGDGEVMIGDFTFNFIECAAYGNGIQMRTKNGKSSAIMNADEFILPVKSIDIKLNDGKQVYDNEHALTFYFGEDAEALGNAVALDTIADQLDYTIVVPEDVNAYFFKLEHSFNYSLYVDSITLNF